MKKWLVFGMAALASGALTWTTLWVTHRDEPAGQFALGWAFAGDRGAGRLQRANPPAMPASNSDVEIDHLVGAEESELPEVIDLTLPARQAAESAEPPLADLPVQPPPATDGTALPPRPTPIVPDFLPHSADGDESANVEKKGLQSFWQRVTAFVWGLSPDLNKTDAPAVPFRMADYHRDHPSCPYTGGCPYGGSSYHSGAKSPSEESPAVPSKRQPHKPMPPAVDTMEIRPGDLPMRWFKLPF
jgi:hypothetical protein